MRYLPWVPFWRLLQLGNPTTFSGLMLPEDGQTHFKRFQRFSDFGNYVCQCDILRVWECEVTLLYEMASNSSLICSGLWMSSSLEDRGWEEVRASTANTLWMSLSTMRSFCWGTNQTACSKLRWSPSPATNIRLFRFDLLNYWGHEVRGKSLLYSRWVQLRLLPGTQRKTQSLHSATSRSTTSVSPDYQTTLRTAKREKNCQCHAKTIKSK